MGATAGGLDQSPIAQQFTPPLLRRDRKALIFKNHMIDDLLKSVKENALERLASPLLGSFVLAWCAWNYKFIVILFSAASVTHTFKLIETIAFPDHTTVLFRGILYPLVSSLAYVFLYPYPARFVYRFTLERQREINSIRKKIEDETPLTLEESRRIRDEKRDSDRQSREKIDQLTQEVTRLQALLSNLSTGNDKVVKAKVSVTSPDELEPSQFELLRLLEGKGGKATEKQIIQDAKEKKVKVEFDLGELVRMNVLSRDFSSREGGFFYTFTHTGRKVLLSGGKYPE